jgi:glutathione S-transferase
MWSDEHEIFNCYMRAYQNTLESIPSFLILLLIAGVMHPFVAVGTGGAWFLGRVLFSLGYYSGTPKNRVPGSLVSMLAMATLFVTSIASNGALVEWWDYSADP